MELSEKIEVMQWFDNGGAVEFGETHAQLHDASVLDVVKVEVATRVVEGV